jgi:hypothetical protein
MMHFKAVAGVVLIGCTVSCASSGPSDVMPGVVSDTYATVKAAPLDATRKIAEQDCSKPIDFDRGNILCR